MLIDDIQTLNQKMLDVKAASLPTLPLFLRGNTTKPDENKIWARFVVNPGFRDPASITSNTIWRTLGTANLQIMQPKNLKLTSADKSAWEIASIAMHAFEGFRSVDKKLEVYRFNTPDSEDEKNHIVSLLIYWRSMRSS